MPDYEFSDGTYVEAIKDFSASFEVPATREEVYRAISNPGEWWDEPAGRGDSFQLDTGDGEFTVVEDGEGDRLVWHVEPAGPGEEDRDWRDTDIIFELEDGDDGETHVRLTHRGLKPHGEHYSEITEGWRRRLAGRLQPLIKRSES